MDLSDFDNHVLPPGTHESWRTWLLTGVRRPPVDRRRVRGAHMGLKRMLVEGMALSAEQPYSWKEFSDAMVRQSVGDAVRALPPQDAQIVKLAYFGSQSNEQIAVRLGISVAMVERHLRDAIRQISRHVERGRYMGRRAIGALVAWISGRFVSAAYHHVAEAGAVATVAIVAIAQPAVSVAPAAPRPPAAVRVFAAPASAAVPAAGRHSSGAPAPGSGLASAGSGVAAAPGSTPSAPALTSTGLIQVPALPVKVPALKPPTVKPPAQPVFRS